jgi:hypothetical protein
MKFFKHIAFAAVASTMLFTSCSEEATLEGAKEVYIEISPSEISMVIGDTVSVSARVTNLSGDEIDTPIAWSVDAEDIATVTTDSLGNTAVAACPGSLGKTTKLRATLVNGLYAVTTVTVAAHGAQSVVPEEETLRMYRNGDEVETDTVWYFVEPYAIVDDYTPTYSIEATSAHKNDPATLEAAEDPFVYDADLHRVGLLVHPSRAQGEFNVTLTVGGGGDTTSGTCVVTMGPSIKVGMWDPDVTGMTSPPTGDQYYGFNYEVRKTVDINTETKIYARVMIDGARAEDIANARDCYSWSIESGSNVLITAEEQQDNQYGYDAVLTLRSGRESGETVIVFTSPDPDAPEMKAYITVKDFDKDYPVNNIIVSPADASMTMDNLNCTVNGNLELNVSIDPITSLAYHRPTVTISDPSVLEYVSYEGTLMLLKGLKPGTTKVTLTSMTITKSFNVTVNDEVLEILWSSAPSSLAVGQSEAFEARVRTVSGAANTFPITWTSSNSSVLSVSSSTSSKNTVTAEAAGKATITATVTSTSGKSLSVSREVTVISGYSDITVTDDNYPGYYPDGNKVGFFFEYNNQQYWIYTKSTLSSPLNGTLTAADFSGAMAGDSSATVSEASLILKNNVASGTVTLLIGGVSQKITFKNVTIDYDI